MLAASVGLIGLALRQPVIVAFIAVGILAGFDSLSSLYVAVALTFSSTIIIVKLLSDKKEINSLHGRIAVASARAIGVEWLRHGGADLGFPPFHDAADQAVALLLSGEPAERILIGAEVEEQVA